MIFVCKSVCEEKETAKSLRLRGFFALVVELQGIEPWSREDERVRSTCLVDFDCRKTQGRQRPFHFLSRCCLDGRTQQATAQFC